MRENSIIVGLDIGTTKITTVIGEVAPDGTIDIIGEGSVPSEGMKRGSVVNLERATQAIKQSLHAAERVSGVRAWNVFVSVGGNHTKAMTSHGLAAIRRQQEISPPDVERAIENARAVPLDPSLEVLHTIPQEYVVDGQEGIKNPVGMHGVRLEVDVHIVAGSAGPLLNLRRCVQEAGLQIEGFVLHSLASGLATLDQSEQNQTTVVVDMGGGTTDIGVFKRGNLAHSASIPIGGDHVTADLAQILKIPMEEAEKVKRHYGAAIPELADQELTLEITTASGATHAISAYELSRVIRPRVSEIYGLIRDEIDQALGPVELVAQSVVLTGGGAQLPGAVDLARERFRLPTRLGRPRGIHGLSDIVGDPAHACSVGMVLYGITQDGRVPSGLDDSDPAAYAEYPGRHDQGYPQGGYPVPGYLTAPTGGVHGGGAPVSLSGSPQGTSGAYPASGYVIGQPQGQYPATPGYQGSAYPGAGHQGPAGPVGGQVVGGQLVGGQVVGVDPHAQVLVDGQPQKPPSGPKVSLMDKVKALFRDWF
ncbi:cell division protein FtsA [Deinococcus wulumuqiensis]|uniref:Cell division protein FtsA n=1 Tax=Deinococcus wulumuqiensis TaxID=980427 RepID=A0A345IHF3_9DEIO|nr:cell division protein FtsA [Deinococcus wulumuqiensis]AXG99125.1 cell division protein FtsA [Deinococcus wulumuqiensis]